VASGILVALGGVLIIFCLWFAVFRLIPAWGKVVQTGDGAGPGLGLLMMLWWFIPALTGLVVGGVLHYYAPASVPVATGRLLAVAAWAGAALAWALPQVSVFLWGLLSKWSSPHP